MKNIKTIIYLLISIFVTGCGNDYVSDSSFTDFESSNSSYLSNPESLNSMDIYIIPESFEINEILYVIDRDFDKSTIIIDSLIGHIIYEKDLPNYLNDYPNLVPIIDNYFRCSDDKISIYTVKSNVDDQIIDNYLAIQYIIENIIFIEIFKLMEEI